MNGLNMIIDPDHIGMDILLVQIVQYYLRYNKSSSLMAAVICIKITRGTFC